MQILEGAANREIDVLFLVGVDPLRDLPDGALARRALENTRFKVVQSLGLGALEPFADAFLPAAAPFERDGRRHHLGGPRPATAARPATEGPGTLRSGHPRRARPGDGR